LEFRYTDGSGTKLRADIVASFINIASGTQTNSVAGLASDVIRTLNAALGRVTVVVKDQWADLLFCFSTA
jgi:hypothetical protein